MALLFHNYACAFARWRYDRSTHGHGCSTGALRRSHFSHRCLQLRLATGCLPSVLFSPGLDCGFDGGLDDLAICIALQRLSTDPDILAGRGKGEPGDTRQYDTRLTSGTAYWGMHSAGRGGRRLLSQLLPLTAPSHHSPVAASYWQRQQLHPWSASQPLLAARTPPPLSLPASAQPTPRRRSREHLGG